MRLIAVFGGIIRGQRGWSMCVLQLRCCWGHRWRPRVVGEGRMQVREQRGGFARIPTVLQQPVERDQWREQVRASAPEAANCIHRGLDLSLQDLLACIEHKTRNGLRRRCYGLGKVARLAYWRGLWLDGSRRGSE